MTCVVTEKDMIIELLKQYKHSPCLWDTSNVYYFNKQMRKDSYKKILRFWQTLDPNSTVESIKKKLEHFRSAYRRERKKVESSIVNGGPVHVPNLWYYKRLAFLNAKSENKESSDDCDDEEKEEYVHVPPKKKKRKSAPKTTKDNKTKDQQNTTSKEEKLDSQDSTTLFGMTVARQLKELDDEVRFEAERIISDVLYRARTGTLAKYTPQVVNDFVIPKCEPSWYSLTDQAESQPNEFLVVTVADPMDQIVKTELENQEE